MPVDHMRGMTAEQVAKITLRSIEKGRNETTLTFQGKLMVFVSRFLPRLADRIAAVYEHDYDILRRNSGGPARDQLLRDRGSVLDRLDIDRASEKLKCGPWKRNRSPS